MERSFNPKIGKTVLETLTSGMYDDARFIYREYIQNAADQIDLAFELGILKEISEGIIDVTIDSINKKISVWDNATGIPEKEILRFLGDVANSHKDGIKQKGFRGIGRLGGLGYCDILSFETSFAGENVRTKMTLDAKLLKRIIENSNDNSDAAAAISIITKVEKKEESEETHFFSVTLENAHDRLLDPIYVEDYLSMVAPVPFSPNFSFTNEIKEYFENRGLVFDEYNIEINGKTLFKRYKDSFNDSNNIGSDLVGVDFVEIRDDYQELMALCWYGYRKHSNYVLDVSNIERGLRIRTKNITVGDEYTCNRFFDQERTNLRFIGEIHTLSSGFRPNARRDYFVENTTCQQFERNAKEIFKLENLENRLAQTASKLHNRLKEIRKFNEVYDDFVTKKGGFENEATESYHLSRLKELERKAIRAEREIEKITQNSLHSNNITNLISSIIGDENVTVKQLTEDQQQISKYTPPVFLKLTSEQQSVILEIFEILEEELDFHHSELIKRRIVEKYN